MDISKERMKEMLTQIPSLIEQANKQSSEKVNISPIIAGFIDIGEGFTKIYFQLLSDLLKDVNNKEILYDKLFDVEDELVNHILSHITDMKDELRKLVIGLE